MILSDMSLAEIAAVLRKDVGCLQRHVAERYADMERQHRKGGKGVIVQTGEFTSADRVQWVYVITISARKTTGLSASALAKQRPTRISKLSFKRSAKSPLK